MREELQKSLNNIDDSNDNYMTIANNLKKKYLTQLLTKLNNKKAFDSWNVSEKEFSNLFEEIIEEQKKKALNKLKTSTIEKLRTLCEQLFNIELETYSKEKNFWKNFNANYLNHFCSKMFPLRVYLKENFSCENDEINEILGEIQEKIYNDTKKSIGKNMRDFSGKMVEQFKKKFLYEKDSNYQEQKNWERYEDLDIDIDFKI